LPDTHSYLINLATTDFPKPETMTDNHHTIDAIHRTQVGLKTGLSAMVNLIIPPHSDSQEIRQFTKDMNKIARIVKRWLPPHSYTRLPVVVDTVADAARVELASAAPSVGEDLDNDEETDIPPALDDNKVATPPAATMDVPETPWRHTDDYAFRANHDDGATWCGFAYVPDPVEILQAQDEHQFCALCCKAIRNDERQEPNICQCTCEGCQMGYANQQGHMDAGGCLEMM